MAISKETSEQYALRRVLETGRPYVITKMGNVFLNHHENEDAVEFCGGVSTVITRASINAT